MGDYITKLFPNPEAMPGGSDWKLTCEANGTQDIDWDEDSTCSWSKSEQDFYGMTQILFLGAAYGYILFFASNEISDGSEKLLMITSWKPIVGTVVLPILGAVPDGAIVLFSGLGDDAQNQISVGVGALAGSTIMLLTIPWFLSIWAGRVKMEENGRCRYMEKPKLPEGTPLFGSGVHVEEAVAKNADFMLLTGVSYLLVQGVLFSVGSHGIASKDDEHYDDLKHSERWWSLGSFFLCLVFFIWYLYKMMNEGANENVFNAKHLEKLKKAIKEGKVDIASAFYDEIIKEAEQTKPDENLTQPLTKNTPSSVNNNYDLVRSIRKVCKPVFDNFDDDKNGFLDTVEVHRFLHELGIGPLQRKVAADLIEKLDANKDGEVSLKEFSKWIPEFVYYVASPEYTDKLAEAKRSHELHKKELQRQRSEASLARAESKMEDGAGQGEESEEEEGEDEEENAQYFVMVDGKMEIDKSKVKKDAFSQMAIGTFLILLFSDPMCDVFTSLGDRIGIDAFFVSFVLAPLASNASELIAALNFASKKTRETITVSLTQLEGAGIMNNTFCLGIFMLLIFAKGLAWEFSAETISILLVEIAIWFIAKRSTQTMLDAFVVLSLYPASLIVVIILEKTSIGLD